MVKIKGWKKDLKRSAIALLVLWSIFFIFLPLGLIGAFAPETPVFNTVFAPIAPGLFLSNQIIGPVIPARENYCHSFEVIRETEEANLGQEEAWRCGATNASPSCDALLEAEDKLHSCYKEYESRYGWVFIPYVLSTFLINSVIYFFIIFSVIRISRFIRIQSKKSEMKN